LDEITFDDGDGEDDDNNDDNDDDEKLSKQTFAKSSRSSL